MCVEDLNTVFKEFLRIKGFAILLEWLFIWSRKNKINFEADFKYLKHFLPIAYILYDTYYLQ